MTALRRRFGVWPALAMIVAEVVGVGVFLTPAAMARTMGSGGWALIVWLVMGLLSIAGALCFAELGTRFPEAGGAYVFIREAFGARTAFVYGWMCLLVMDPGVTAALGVGLAQYVVAITGAPPVDVPAVAIVCIVVLAGISLLGAESSARIMRWSVAAKIAVVALLVSAAIAPGGAERLPTIHAGAPGIQAFAAAIIAAFFAFGGWWDLGKMTEELVDARRTLPIALVGGVAVVTAIYGALSVAFARVASVHPGAGDEALVAAVGARMFGSRAAVMLAGGVVVAVAGSLAAVLLGAPRVYLAMARGGVLPASIVRFDERRQSAPLATLVQVALACTLVLVGSFDQILGYFVPTVVFFVGLAASAMLVLPRLPHDAPAYRAPWHPVPVVLFLLLVVTMVVLFAAGRPLQTLMGAAVAFAGVPLSWLVMPPRRSRPAAASEAPSTP